VRPTLPTSLSQMFNSCASGGIIRDVSCVGVLKRVLPLGAYIVDYMQSILLSMPVKSLDASV
jgi:hypothetical protein